MAFGKERSDSPMKRVEGARKRSRESLAAARMESEKRRKIREAVLSRVERSEEEE